MNGMRTKGADFDTSFGPLTASKEVLLPLSRLQRVADKQIPTEPAKVLLDGEEFYLVGIDSTHVYMTTTPTPEPFPKNMPLHVGQLPSKELAKDAYEWLGGDMGALNPSYSYTRDPRLASKTSAASHEIPGTNLSISGFGRDTNGNSLVYVNTPNQRRRGIQLGGMNAVEEAMKQGMEFFTKADPAQIAEVEQEILNYVQKYERGKTKENLHVYPKQASSDYSSEEIADAIMNGNEFIQTYFGNKSRQGIYELLMGTYTAREVADALLNDKPQLNTAWGKKNWQGVTEMVTNARSSTATTKKAAIYDNYGTRVTIETKAGETNESYTMVLSMLKGADILYREVKRYTINPDRVVLEVMVRNQDLEVIKELAKEAEKEGVKIYLSENISESIKSKTIVTEEEEVEKKVEATKKTATTGNEWGSMFQDIGINIGQADILWDKINTLGGSLTFDNYVSAGNKSEMIDTLSKLADTLQLALASVTVLSGAISEEGSESQTE